MKKFALFFAALLAAIVAAVAVRAGPDNVKFPANYAKGVLYHTVDRADLKQFRELFITKFAAEEAKAGRPLPSGTVITMVNYKAKLGADGQPEKDSNGRFIKTDEIAGIAVMEKRMGWGAEYPADMRNGESEALLHLPPADGCKPGLRVHPGPGQSGEVAASRGVWGQTLRV
jgi:hypothetical protein